MQVSCVNTYSITLAIILLAFATLGNLQEGVEIHLVKKCVVLMYSNQNVVL